MTRYLYIAIVIFILSCQTEPSTEMNSVKADSELDSIPIVVKTDQVDVSTKSKYPFIEELNKLGFGTDTNRLKHLAEYAYWDLRKTPFKLDENAITNNLDIKKSRVLEFIKFDNKDSLFTTSLKNGKGFYFVQVDSNGIGQKNSFDFGMEIWDYQGSDTSLLIKSWKDIYYPMPLHIELLGNQLYVFYTRRSVDYKFLIEIKNKIIKAPNMNVGNKLK